MTTGFRLYSSLLWKENKLGLIEKDALSTNFFFFFENGNNFGSTKLFELQLFPLFPIWSWISKKTKKVSIHIVNINKKSKLVQNGPARKELTRWFSFVSNYFIENISFILYHLTLRQDWDFKRFRIQ